MGLLCPNFITTFGSVFGLAFGLEGFSFFLEAIFIAIYVLATVLDPPSPKQTRSGRSSSTASGTGAARQQHTAPGAP